MHWYRSRRTRLCGGAAAAGLGLAAPLLCLLLTLLRLGLPSLFRKAVFSCLCASPSPLSLLPFCFSEMIDFGHAILVTAQPVQHHVLLAAGAWAAPVERVGHGRGKPRSEAWNCPLILLGVSLWGLRLMGCAARPTRGWQRWRGQGARNVPGLPRHAGGRLRQIRPACALSDVSR